MSCFDEINCHVSDKYYGRSVTIEDSSFTDSLTTWNGAGVDVYTYKTFRLRDVCLRITRVCGVSVVAFTWDRDLLEV